MAAEMECRYCNRSGLYFEEDTRSKRCFKHATEDQRELVEQLDQRAPDLGLSRNRVEARRWGQVFDWPYGPNVYVPGRAALVDWAGEHRLKVSRSASRCAMHWLTGGRCDPYRLNPYSCRAGGNSSWFDHVTRWNLYGSPRVLVAQPYGLSDADRADLERIVDSAPFWTGARLRLEVGPTGWYGHGTTWVALWRENWGDRNG